MGGVEHFVTILSGKVVLMPGRPVKYVLFGVVRVALLVTPRVARTDI